MSKEVAITKSPILAALCALTVLSGAARAEEAFTYALAGVGNSSCGTWTAARKRRPDGWAWGYEQWVVGFLSGAGLGSNATYITEPNPQGTPLNPMNGLDLNAAWAWVDNYCRDHPLDTIGTAGTSLVKSHPR